MSEEEAPKPVKDTFEALRNELNKKLSLHKISGSYYVYEYETVRDQKRRKTVVKTYYIGHITKYGKYISKEQRKLASMEAKSSKQEETSEDEPYDEREAIALRNLSMNGRMSMNMLSKRIGMSVSGTRHFVKRLEEKYKIRYFADINEFELGYRRYVGFIKFKGIEPNNSVIKNAFNDNPNTLFVASTKGMYNLIVIFYLNVNDNPTYFLYNLRNSTLLKDYTWKIYVTIMGRYWGSAIDLREPFFELLHKESHGKIKSKYPGNYILTEKEYFLIKEISKDGKIDFKKIDEKYGLERGRSNYMFYKLKQKNIVNMISIIIKPPNIKYNAIFLVQTNNYKAFSKSREKWLKSTLFNNNQYTNKYVFIGDIVMPDGILHIAPIFKDDDFKKISDELNSISGTQTNTLIITEIILGALCYRNYDADYLDASMMLEHDYSIKKIRKETYA